MLVLMQKITNYEQKCALGENADRVTVKKRNTKDKTKKKNENGCWVACRAAPPSPLTIWPPRKGRWWRRRQSRRRKRTRMRKLRGLRCLLGSCARAKSAAAVTYAGANTSNTTAIPAARPCPQRERAIPRTHTEVIMASSTRQRVSVCGCYRRSGHTKRSCPDFDLRFVEIPR